MKKVPMQTQIIIDQFQFYHLNQNWKKNILQNVYETLQQYLIYQHNTNHDLANFTLVKVHL